MSTDTPERQSSNDGSTDDTNAHLETAKELFEDELTAAFQTLVEEIEDGEEFDESTLLDFRDRLAHVGVAVEEAAQTAGHINSDDVPRWGAQSYAREAFAQSVNTARSPRAGSFRRAQEIITGLNQSLGELAKATVGEIEPSADGDRDRWEYFDQGSAWFTGDGVHFGGRIDDGDGRLNLLEITAPSVEVGMSVTKGEAEINNCMSLTPEQAEDLAVDLFENAAAAREQNNE